MLPFDVAVQATNATVFDIESAPDRLRIVTDTRSLVPGDTFLALRGEQFDGHAYIREAIAKGAVAAIVDDPEARMPGKTTLVVENTLLAYMALGGAARDRFNGKVLAITGSAGKTTTKAFAAQLLAQRYGERVIASPANENNEIGVSKLLLNAANEKHDVIVVEMGARHYGEIVPLVDIAKPNVGILTNIGEAHLEIMGSRERLEETKWGLFSSGAKAVLNAQDTASIARAPSLGRSPHWFFAGESAVPVTGRATALIGREELVEASGGRSLSYAVDVRVPGTHNRENLAAAAAAALELDVRIEAIVRAIPSLELPAGRYQSIHLAGGVRIVYDAYNANATGTIAALDAFAEESAQRRIAVLASMAELGEEAPALHARVGAHAARTHVDVLLVGGDHASELAAGAAGAGLSSERIVPFATNLDAARWLREHAHAGDVILLKGSRKYKLEEIVEELGR
jgi:UDP-N-acetylmuramoyl-tripeptide--D-alanyl-D-alanine ligase